MRNFTGMDLLHLIAWYATRGTEDIPPALVRRIRRVMALYQQAVTEWPVPDCLRIAYDREQCARRLDWIHLCEKLTRV